MCCPVRFFRAESNTIAGSKCDPSLPSPSLSVKVGRKPRVAVAVARCNKSKQTRYTQAWYPSHRSCALGLLDRTTPTCTSSPAAEDPLIARARALVRESGARPVTYATVKKELVSRFGAARWS